MDEDGDHLVNYQEPETWRWAGSDGAQLWLPGGCCAENFDIYAK